jgi:hypothetical protein
MSFLCGQLYALIAHKKAGASLLRSHLWDGLRGSTWGFTERLSVLTPHLSKYIFLAQQAPHANFLDRAIQ